eukprot:SAG22_NODE_418_length_10750_cov_11.722280_3_plen_161_part_00
MQSGPRRTASGQFAKRKGGQAAAEEKGGGTSSDEGDDFVTADLDEPDRPSSKEAKEASGGTVHALPVEDSSPTEEAELGALKGLISGQLEEATAELVSHVQLLLQQDRVEAAAEGERRLQQLDETLERRLAPPPARLSAVGTGRRRPATAGGQGAQRPTP